MSREYLFVSETLSRVVKDDVTDRIELEIGDSKQVDAYPQAKITRWDNEVNLSIRRDNGARSFARVGDQVRFESATEDVVIYELDGFEDGGLEIELHLKERPKSNVFEFSIETKGLNFFYQDELTSEEIARGDKRPENVVGSYAVYHATKKHNLVGGKAYKTGKFAHIYRPHVVDADGNETWADLNVDIVEKKLTVTVPQDFLAKATYPVVVDPTLGYTTLGGSSANLSYNVFGSYTSGRAGGSFSSVEAGAVDSITVGLQSDVSTANTALRVYMNEKDSAGTDSHGEVASGSDTITTPGSTDTWFTVTSTGSFSSSTLYLISAALDGDDCGDFQGASICTDNTNQPNLYVKQTSTATYAAEDPWNVSIDAASREASIYCTYTAVAAPEGLALYYKDSGTFRQVGIPT